MLIDATRLFHPSIAWTAGSVLTSPGEAMTFMRALLRGELLSEASLDEMTDVRSCELLGGTVDYGLGLMRYGTPHGAAWGHGGLNFGYQVANLYFPKADVSLARMHSYLPEQGASLQEELLRLVFEGPPGRPGAPCVAPDGFYDGLEEPYARFSFRGELSEKKPGAKAGIASAVARVKGKRIGLSAFPVPAHISENPFGDRVEINAVATALASGVDARTGNLSFQPKLLIGAGEDGIAETSGSDRYELSLALIESQMKPGSLDPERLCVVAVTDAKRTSKAFSCAAGEKIGDALAFHAAVALTTDEAEIDTYVAPFLPARCACAAEGGGWEKCP